MDPEYIKDEEKLVEHLSDFIYDVIYGSIHNFHVQAFHQTGGHLEEIDDFNKACVSYVQGYLARYFNKGISDWIKDEPENKFQTKIFPIKEVLNHGYSCFLGLMMRLCILTLRQVNLSQVKFNVENMEVDYLMEHIDDIIEENMKEFVGCFNHKCENQDDIKDWPDKPIFSVEPLKDAVAEKTLIGHLN